jgi:hypothetical protein
MGPGLCTPAEAERIVHQAIDHRVDCLEAHVDELRSRATRYDLVLHEGRRIVHSLACDLAAPSSVWQSRCGWHFAAAPGWRLSCTAGASPPEGWKLCAKCTPLSLQA